MRSSLTSPTRLLRSLTPSLAVLIAIGISSFDSVLGQEPSPPQPIPPQQVAPDHAAKMEEGRALFKKSVGAILTNRCLKCHGEEKVEGGLDLSTRELLLKGGDSGASIVPGKPNESLLYKLVAHIEEPAMPEDGAKLADEGIEQIAKWIELGAPYDKSLKEDNSDPNAWTKKVVESERKSFWSFAPLQNPTPPTTPGDNWSTNDVDRFVYAKLLQQKLTPNSKASKQALIRRLYFDLIGLPPSYEEVQSFVNDSNPNAYSKLVEHLLESPHFGERWGRHWLDVARFGESHGFEQDYDRPHAYHYRDFVIKAFNMDLPYDQFVKWQLAGDEFAPENPLAMTATGFLGAGVFPTQLTEKEFESARYDELDDMVSTIGNSMLGLSLGCARCHDHKYDPVPMGDYYRFASAFSRAIRSNVDLTLNSDEYDQKLSEWRTAHDLLVAELAKHESGPLKERFADWLAEVKQKPQVAVTTDKWQTVEFTGYTSKGGATLTLNSDGSVSATGTNPDFDTYEFQGVTFRSEIRSIRLDALAMEGLVRNGPGRAGNGNFGLSTFSLFIQPLDGSAPETQVRFENVRATFEQNNSSLSIASSLDDNPKSGWAVDPQFGKDHSAIFSLKEPIGFPNGTRLRFVLDFQLNNQHNFGKTRLSFGTSPQLDFAGELEPQGNSELAALGKLESLQESQKAGLLKWFARSDARWLKLNEQVMSHNAAKPQPQKTTAMVTSEGVKPIPHHADDRGFPHFYPVTFYLKRGDITQKSGETNLGFLQTLNRAEHQNPTSTESFEKWLEQPPAGSPYSYRRRSVANWMTDVELGAGPLLARVIVNRLWHLHFGRGIVGTPSDFGFQGDRPANPELLDYLASELVRSGWSMKHVHRLIVNSTTYQQDSSFDANKSAIDRENRYCWRYAPRRLESEIIRDSLLKVSEQLDPTMFGPGTLDEGMKRRSIYFFVKRSQLIPMMQLFDSPEPLVSQGARPSTTIAPQALVFMNNPHVRRWSLALAEKTLAASKSDADFVNAAYRSILSRDASAKEQELMTAFMSKQRDSYQQEGNGDAAKLAAADLCQVVFSMNEFVFVD